MAFRLPPLFPAQGTPVPVHPVTGERLACPARLGKFALVVREDQVQAAAMDGELVTQVLGAHDRALDVPARIALAPGAVPAHEVALLCLLPDRSEEHTN